MFVKHYGPNYRVTILVCLPSEKTITLTYFFFFFFFDFVKEVNQVVYLSFPISIPYFKDLGLVQILFEISCWQDSIVSYRLTMHKVNKGHNSGTISPTEKKKQNKQSTYFPSLFHI